MRLDQFGSPLPGTIEDTLRGPLERIAPPLGFSLLAWLRANGWASALVLVLLVAWWLV